MVYADVDFWTALLKDDDWLADRAEAVLEENRGDLEVSVATFIELYLIEERLAFDRERATVSIFELAESTVSEDVVFQASEYIDDGANVFDAFHASIADEGILSSDSVFDDLGLRRVQLEPDDG